MGTTLDGQKIFDEQDLKIEIGSSGRSSMERKVFGLDGVLSIDMGGRSRTIRQIGILRAGSRAQMDDRIGTISAYMDGGTHKLVIESGEEFDNVRVDGFKVTKELISGAGLCCGYEIIYTQLAV